jgi:hypothetical protein
LAELLASLGVLLRLITVPPTLKTSNLLCRCPEDPVLLY